MHMPETNIPINKGNYSMETPEREALFERYRGEGWEDEYREYRANWTKYAREQYVSEYPLLVDLELSSICNLNCPMCYTITAAFREKVNATLMDFGLFTAVIDEIYGKVPAVRLSLRGEPTLHKQFVECIRYAKSKGIREVSFLTNGSRLSAEYFEQIMDAGADWITVSLDGLGDTYESIRKPLRFDGMLENLKEMKSIKERHGTHKPVIKVQSVWPAIRDDPQLFYETLAPYVDLIAFNPLIDYLANDREILYEDNFSCAQLYQRCVIGADGVAMMCANDEGNAAPIGNANTESIYEIWHGKKLQHVRAIHRREDGFLEIPVCRKCYLPRSTEDDEVAVVQGREFIVKNYVDRSQVVGT